MHPRPLTHTIMGRVMRKVLFINPTNAGRAGIDQSII
jgi:hypothetical protein